MNEINNLNHRRIARYYDMIHSELTDDIDFILSLADGKPHSILELGCGTGRIVIPLARAGHEVLGLDNSKAMLDLAMGKLEKEEADTKSRICFVNGDMTSFSLEGQFSQVIISHNTLNELTRAEVEKTFDRIKSHLADAGSILIDIANPSVMVGRLEDDLKVMERQFRDPETGLNVRQSSLISLDVVQHKMHVEWTYEAAVREGIPANRTKHRITYHLIYPHELELLLGGARLTLVKMYGGYHREPYGENSDRLIAIAQPQKH